MKYVSLFLALVVLCACGGGGGGTGGGGGGGVTTPNAVAQQILENCAGDSIQDFLAVFNSFTAVLDPQATPPAFNVINIDLVNAIIEWELDVDNNGSADLMGTMGFTDDTGAPTVPFDLTQLLGGLDNLPGLISSIPDGTLLVVGILSLAPPDVTGDIEFSFLGGAVNEVSGTVLLQGVPCQLDIRFTDIPYLDALGTPPFPATTFELLVLDTQATLSGTIEFDGTDTAVIEIAQDSDPKLYAYEIDLTTGAITQLPDP